MSNAVAAPRAERHESLDVLRGIAVMGILMMNVQAFAMIPEAYQNPLVQAPFDEAGQAVWRFSTTFFMLKFITIFSALFGAGIVLMAGADANPERARLHRRRMWWLLLIGAVHSVLWFGDILVSYAIAGLLVAGARRWAPRRLIVVGGLFILLNALIFLAVFAGIAAAPEEVYRAQIQPGFAPPPDVIAETTALYREDFFSRLPGVLGHSFGLQIAGVVLFLPRTIGVMMLGMALFKSGFLTLKWPPFVYLACGVVAVALGAAGSDWSARAQIASSFDFQNMVGPQMVLYWASLVQSFGYACLIMLACMAAWGRLVRAPFAAAGRMAFTNYLATTAASVLVFYGPPGLGLIGTFDRPQQVQYVLIAWAVMLVVSPLWLSVFRFGPMEWLWRSLTYGGGQPMRRAKAA